MTELFNSQNAPHIPKHILEAIYRFDPNLRITWSEYAIARAGNGDPLPQKIFHPRHHVWLEGEDGRRRYLFPVEDPEGNPMPVSEKWVIGRIKTDLARQHNLTQEQIMKLSEDLQERIQAKRQKAMDDWEKSVAEVLQKTLSPEREVTLERDAKPVSYPGQENRSTPGKVEKSDEEIGLEIPPLPNIKKIK